MRARGRKRVSVSHTDTHTHTHTQTHTHTHTHTQTQTQTHTHTHTQTQTHTHTHAHRVLLLWVLFRCRWSRRMACEEWLAPFSCDCVCGPFSPPPHYPFTCVFPPLSSTNCACFIPVAASLDCCPMRPALVFAFVLCFFSSHSLP